MGMAWHQGYFGLFSGYYLCHASRDIVPSFGRVSLIVCLPLVRHVHAMTLCPALWPGIRVAGLPPPQGVSKKLA